MNPTATLNALQAAEARIAGTIQQTALAVDGIGANTQQALAQLAVALDNARARLAVDLTTFAEMMGETFASFNAAADLIAAPLAISAPVLPPLPTRELSDLDQPSAGQAVSDPAGMRHGRTKNLVRPIDSRKNSDPPSSTDAPASETPRQAIQQGREAQQSVEAARESSTVEIAPQRQPQATECGIDVPQALKDLATMPEVSRMVCCVHNGVGVPAEPQIWHEGE